MARFIHGMITICRDLCIQWLLYGEINAHDDYYMARFIHIKQLLLYGEIYAYNNYYIVRFMHIMIII